jgi:hypothetical protein
MAALPTAVQATVLNHPESRRTLVRVAELLAALDASDGAADFSQLQDALLIEAIRSSRAANQCRRAVKRLDKRKAADWRDAGHVAEIDSTLPDIPSWELEIDPSTATVEEWLLETFVANLSCRHFRMVGDGLAWKAYDYDKAPIIALSRNQGSGSIYDSGLPTEIRYLRHLWTNRGEFALLHDLTSVLRIGDLTIFGRDGRKGIMEVKASQGASNLKRQEEIINDAIKSSDGHLDLVGSPLNVRLWRSAAALNTHMAKATQVLRAALRDGQSTLPFDGRVLSALYFPYMASRSDPQQIIDGRLRSISEAVQGLGPEVGRTLHMISNGSGEPSALFAPFSIFPMTPQERAAFICGYAIVETLTTTDYLCGTLRNSGLSVSISPAPDGPTIHDTPIIRASDGRVAATVTGLSIAQYLYELHDSHSFVEAVMELIGLDVPPTNPVLIFSNEREVWRDLHSSAESGSMSDLMPRWNESAS